MAATERINRLLKSRGRKLTHISDGEPTEFYAFLQPMRYKNKMYLDSQYTELGIVDESCFLFIGPADMDFAENSDLVIDENDKSYSFVKVEKVYCCGNPAYTWAIMRIRS